MAIVNPDFSEGPSFQPGEYNARINTAEVKTSKAGNPYVSLRLAIDGGPHNGTTVFLNTALNGAGANRFRSLVQAAFDPKYSGGPFDLDSLINCAVRVRLVREEGNKYLQVDEVMPPAEDDVGF